MKLDLRKKKAIIIVCIYFKGSVVNKENDTGTCEKEAWN